MTKVSERDRIAALEAKLKQLKVLQQRKEARARTVESRRSRREELRRKILVGAVVGTESRGPGRRRPIALRSPCFAQARGDLPWSPVQRVRWTRGGCGKNVLRFCDPASRRKPVACQSTADPARRMRRALFFTPRPASSRPHSCAVGMAVSSVTPQTRLPRSTS
jgi:hypothetical protein